VAAQDVLIGVDDMEVGVHGLVVGDALGVVALDDVDEVFCQLHLVLLDHLIVVDDVHHGVGGDDGDAVECLFGDVDVGNLDDAFSLHAATVEVVTDSDAVLHFIESQQVDHLEQRVARNMVYHDAVAQSGHGHFFLIVLH